MIPSTGIVCAAPIEAHSASLSVRCLPCEVLKLSEDLADNTRKALEPQNQLKALDRLAAFTLTTLKEFCFSDGLSELFHAFGEESDSSSKFPNIRILGAVLNGIGLCESRFGVVDEMWKFSVVTHFRHNVSPLNSLAEGRVSASETSLKESGGSPSAAECRQPNGCRCSENNTGEVA